MVKRGGGRGRGRGNASAVTGAQAAGSSTKNENKSKQEKSLKKNLTDLPTEDRAGKRDNLESILGTPAATAKAKVAKAKKRANLEDVKFTSDNKTIDKSPGNAATKKDFCEKEQEEESSEVLTDILKMESLVGKDSVEIKKISSKQSHSTDKPLIDCASLPQAKIGECLSVSEFLKIAKHHAINKLKKRIPDPLASKVLHEVLSLENERKVTEKKSETDVSMLMLQHSKQTDDRELTSDLKASKVKQEISSKNEKKVIEENCYEDDFVPMLQYSQDIDEQKLNLDLKTSKVRQESSSKNKSKIAESKTDENESTPMFQCSEDIGEQTSNLAVNASKMQQEIFSENENKLADTKFDVDESMSHLQYSKDTDEKKLNSDLKASKEKRGFSSENEIKIAESKTDGNESTPIMHIFKEIPEGELNMDLKTSKVVQEVTERKFEVDGSPSWLQGTNLKNIIDKIQNFDLDNSNTKHIISLQHQNKMKESETEKIINLRRDVNLRFEFDTLGNKKVLVDDKDQYNPDIEQKIAFNIGGGIAKLSFIDKKICIFTQGGEIDCSIRKNQVVFSLTDSTALSESSLEVLSTSKISHNKDTEDFKDLCNKNTNGTAKKGCLHPSEEMQLESGSTNLNVSSLKPNLNLVSSSVTQQRLQSTTENFLSSIMASCRDFENEFLRCFNERLEVTLKR